MVKKDIKKPEIDSECAICGKKGNYKANFFNICKKCGKEVCELCTENDGLCIECEKYI